MWYSILAMAGLDPLNSPVTTQPHDEEVGLCRSCRNVRVVRSDRGSVFYQCKLAAVDPRHPQYPQLPVLRCPGYVADGDAGVSA